MIIRFRLNQLCLSLVFLGLAAGIEAGPLAAERTTDYDEVAFQITYRHMPLRLSLPKLSELTKTGAAMKLGLGRMAYCDEFISLHNPLDSVLGVATRNLNFRIPETVAKITFGVGGYTFQGDLQVGKEVCDYEGEQFVLYQLAAESGFVFTLPVTEKLLNNLQSVSMGTLEVNYSISREFDTDGVLQWDASSIGKYAGAALEALQAQHKTTLEN